VQPYHFDFLVSMTYAGNVCLFGNIAVYFTTPFEIINLLILFPFHEWEESVCSIEDLCFISLRSADDGGNIKENGIPIKLTQNGKKHTNLSCHLWTGITNLN
jgi:hypothetical protein